LNFEYYGVVPRIFETKGYDVPSCTRLVALISTNRKTTFPPSWQQVAQFGIPFLPFPPPRLLLGYELFIILSKKLIFWFVQFGNLAGTRKAKSKVVSWVEFTMLINMQDNEECR